MPENSNQSKLSNYSIDTEGTNGIDCGLMSDLFGVSSINFNTSYSIWIKPEFAYNTGTYQTFFGNLASGNFGVLLYYHIGEDKWFFIAGNGSSNQKIKSAQITSDAELGRGEWQHHCVVYDYENSSAYYYINNSLVSTTSSLSITINNTGKNWHIGKKWDLSSGTFTGNVAQACIFNYALSTDQITYLYNLNNPMAITGAKPIAYWPLGDNSNPNATAGYPNAAIGGSVFDFDGTSTRSLTLTNNSGLESALSNVTEFTFSAWYNWADLTSASKTVFLLKNGSNYRLNINMYTVGDFLRFAINQDGGFAYSQIGSYDNQPTPDLQNNKWFHMCGVLDGAGATNDDKIKLYLNGQDVGPLTFTGGSGVAATSLGALPASNNLLQIGGRINSSFPTYDGMFTNIQMWDKALTSSEVTTLYNSGKVLEGTQPQASNLQFWYKLDGVQDFYDGSNWTIKDYGLSGTNITTSSGMDSSSLVSDNTIRSTTSPYSSYSVNFDSLDYFADTGGGFFNGATSVSVSSWMRMDSVSSINRIITSNWPTTASQRQYLLRWSDNTGNGFQFYLYGPGGATSPSFVLAESGSTVTAVADRWYNVVGTWDGSNIKIYVDGVERGSEASSGSVQSVTNANWIGRYSTSSYMDGNLSNIAYWKNTALTQAEVTEIYNAGVPTDLSNFSGTAPTYWYTLDGKKVYYNGSVLVARDAIGTQDLTGVNLVQENIQGIGPGSYANGTGSNLDITDLRGDMSNSTKNSYSINMADYGDPNGQGVTPANSGRTTSVPG